MDSSVNDTTAVFVSVFAEFVDNVTVKEWINGSTGSGCITVNISMNETCNSSVNEAIIEKEYESPYPFSTPLGKGFVLGVYGMMTLLGMLFNAMTIIVFTWGKRSSVRDIRILIINLAVVDMVYSISGPIPNALDIINVSFPDNVILCRMYRFTYIFSTYGSPLANLAIAIERLVIVFSPVRTLRLRNRRRTMLYIISAFWLYDLLVTVEYLYSPIIKQGEYDGHVVLRCRSNTHLGQTHPKAFIWLLLLKFVGPAVLITIIYIIIGVKLTMCRPVGTVSMDENLKKQSRARNQMVKMLTIVAFVTVVAWAPYNIWAVMEIYDDPLDNVEFGFEYADTILFALQLTNGFTSPIVYFVYDRYFKRDFYELFGCGWYRSRKPGASSQFTQTTTTARTIRGPGNTVTHAPNGREAGGGLEHTITETEIR